MKTNIIIDNNGILQDKFINETFVYIVEKKVLSGKIPKNDFIKAKISKIKNIKLNQDAASLSLTTCLL